MFKKSLLVLVVLFFLLSFPLLAGDVTLHIAIVNPSESATENVPIRQDLPLRVQKDDILDAAGLKINYNEASDTYYLEGEFTLEPKETRNLKVHLRDIWNVPPQRIESLKTMLDNRVESIRGEERREIARLIGDDLHSKLDEIMREQAEAEGDIEERMKLYSVNQEQLRQIEDDIFSLNSLIGIYKRGREEDLGSVSIFIEAENLWDRQEVLPIRYYLPASVIPQYVIDSGGFEVKHDPHKGVFFLEKEVMFDPREIKRYQLEIKNIWHIRKAVLEQYGEEANELKQRLLETEAADIAKELYRAIEEDTEAIISSQERAETISERIAAYKANQERLARIKENVDRLRALVIEFPDEILDVAEEAVRDVMERLEQLTTVDLTDFAQRLAERLRQIGVWRVVYTIILFIIGITLFFYGLWFFRLKKEEKDKEKLEEKS